MVVARGDEIDAEIVLMSLLFIKNKIARSRSHNRATPVQRERLTYYLQVIHDRDAVDHRSLGGEWSLHAGRVPHLYEGIIRRGDKIACAHAPNERYCQQEARAAK